MRNTLMLTLVLLLSAVGLQAQDTMAKSESAAGATTIQGCLSNHNGQYWLTESNGTVHQLSSNAQKLKDHIGHEVAITGMPGVKTVDTTIQGAASSANQIPVFKVKSVQHVADTCTAAGH